MIHSEPSLAREPSSVLTEVAHLRDLNKKIVMLLSHELGTPLTHILAYLFLWQERAPLSERVELDMAVEQALTLKARLDDILLLDQLEAGLWELRCAPTSMQEIIARVIQEQRWRIEDKGLALTTHIACTQLVCADKEMLYRALTQLVTNACKFSNARGAIELRAENRDDVCAVSVRDHGIGIPVEKQAKIFESFFQVDLTHARRYNGLGIGLKLVRAIIEKHGGTIYVQSEMGKGSTFTVTIPLV